MDDYIDAATAYGTGATCMVIDWHGIGNGFLFWGSIVLLSARLCVDLPKAIRAIKDKWRDNE